MCLYLVPIKELNYIVYTRVSNWGGGYHKMMCGINIGTLLLLLAANFILGFKWELEMIHDFLITGDLKSFTVNIYSCWGKGNIYSKIMPFI